MLLTITYTGHETQNLGYLLQKNPNRSQQFEISYGKAYVFYPEVSDERTTAALLLDIDPLDLAKGKVGSSEGGLFDYVNDRPYVCSSFMSTAIARIFGSALNGKCKEKPELADTPIDLSATIYSLKDNGYKDNAQQLFEPLGYKVETKRSQLDEKFPEWGESPYIDLTISGKVKISDLLKHIYVLIPVFDTQKHYYIDESEINKLLKHGEGWLSQHPYKEKITRRFLGKRAGYIKKAKEALDAEIIEDGIAEEAPVSEIQEKLSRTPLNSQRLEAIKTAVLKSGAKSVVDLGCGEGRLAIQLAKEPQLNKVTAFDVSTKSLDIASEKERKEKLSPEEKEKLNFKQASLTYKDSRFLGYDCACLVEVIEHIDLARIHDVERIVFGFASPKTVIVTTPNREYNTVYGMTDGLLRHRDHRFEWTREEFIKWAENICGKYRYTCDISGIGDMNEEFGQPTQMGVFKKL